MSEIKQYARHHDFNYPTFGRKLRRLSNRKLFARASGGEDSAFVAYRALNAKSDARRKALIRKLRKGNF